MKGSTYLSASVYALGLGLLAAALPSNRCAIQAPLLCVEALPEAAQCNC